MNLRNKENNARDGGYFPILLNCRQIKDNQRIINNSMQKMTSAGVFNLRHYTLNAMIWFAARAYASDISND